MNISGFSPASSAYASAANRSLAGGTGADEKGTDLKSAAGKGKTGELGPEEAAQVAKLKQTDREVRQHEQAHLAASGGLAISGANYTYQKGPDGINYAVGGEVSISTSPGRTPEETIQRARTIHAAATAPANPSSQDRAVAAQASKMETEARMELVAQKALEKTQEGTAEKATQGGDPDARRQTQLADFYAASPSTRGQTIRTYA